MLRLIVVADDLGASISRNEGILQGLKDGIVTSTSLMANGNASDHAVEMMKREPKYLADVGLHLNLTEGKPLSDTTLIPSLLDPTRGSERTFRGKVAFRTACALGKINLDELVMEVKAQLQWFSEAIGPPRHLDGHQHCHVIPAIVSTLAHVFHGVGVEFLRIPAEPGSERSLCSVCSIVSDEANNARSIYRRVGIGATEAFVGLSLCGIAYSQDDLVTAIQTQVDRGAVSCEVMTHPRAPIIPSITPIITPIRAVETPPPTTTMTTITTTPTTTMTTTSTPTPTMPTAITPPTTAATTTEATTAPSPTTSTTTAPTTPSPPSTTTALTAITAITPPTPTSTATAAPCEWDEFGASPLRERELRVLCDPVLRTRIEKMATLVGRSTFLRNHREKKKTEPPIAMMNEN